MLKKFEVKAQPHPERPDRLRAIAASLATAGMLRLLPLNLASLEKKTNVWKLIIIKIWRSLYRSHAADVS